MRELRNFCIKNRRKFYINNDICLANKVKAISEGDVQKLVQLQLDEKMDDGFFDSMLDEVYGFLKLCLVGVILWNVVPIIYTRYVHNKAKTK